MPGPSDRHRGAAGATEHDFEVQVSYGSRRERREAERDAIERDAAALRALQEREQRALEAAALEQSLPEPEPEREVSPYSAPRGVPLKSQRARAARPSVEPVVEKPVERPEERSAEPIAGQPGPQPSEPSPAEPVLAASVMPVPTGARPGESSRRTRRSEQSSTPAPSRAGRNLPAAIGVGLGLGTLVVASLFIRKEAFVAVVVVALCLAVWELTNAFAARRITVPLAPILVGTVGMQVSAYAGGQEALLVAFVLTALGLLLWRVLEGVDGAVRDVAAGVFTSAYGPFLAGFAVLMLVPADGAWRIFTFLIVAVCSDVGGYVFGVLWGRHPMAPSVSPKKSWEGFAGSALFSMVGGVAAVVWTLDGPWWAGLVVGVAAVVTATVGDLSESLLKRDLGIKDMGSLLPGHGGIMDRLDSLLPTAPVMYLLLTLLVPVAA